MSVDESLQILLSYCLLVEVSLLTLRNGHLCYVTVAETSLLLRSDAHCVTLRSSALAKDYNVHKCAVRITA